MGMFEFEEAKSFTSDDALDDEGYVLAPSDSNTGYVRKAPTSISDFLDVPIGVAYNDMKQYSAGSWTATTSEKVALQRVGFGPIKIYSDGASPYRSENIVPFCKIVISSNTAGYADREGFTDDDQPTAAEMSTIVGTAWESLATTSEDGSMGTKKILGLIHPTRYFG